MATDVEILPATLEHAWLLAGTLRPEDAAEIRASGGYEPFAGLKESLVHSDFARTAVFNGQVAAMWGVGPSAQGTALVRSPIGIPWLLTGKAVNRHPKTFFRLCPPAITGLLQLYPVLVNAIDARYTAALRWAARLGFEVRPAEPFGVAGLPFHRIWMRRTHV